MSGNLPVGSSSLMTAMNDPLRPSDEEFRCVLHESFGRWSSCFDEADGLALSHHCVNLKNLLGPIPPFLAHGNVLDHGDGLVKNWLHSLAP